MRLGEIDLSLATLEPKFFLCKPDKTVIKPLKDIYNKQYSSRLGKVNEINFTIPSKIERNHELIDNPMIDDIKHRYLIKLIFNGVTEYFVFFEQNKQLSESEEIISYQAYGLGYLLADKQIRDYEVTSHSLTQMATAILQETNWKIDYVDVDYDLKLRSHEIANMTVLQAIYELAEKFNALIVWNTRNEEISFYKPNNVGLNRGLRFKEGKYLESFNYTTNSEETVTRLRVYGKDGLTFRKLSPTGSNYLEDFSWYMYPFERDAEGVVIKSSDYMSDGLCIALEDYGELLTSMQGQFDTITAQLTAKQDEIRQVGQELVALELELRMILDELDVINGTGESGTPEHVDVISRRDAKNVEIAAKDAEMTELKNQETAIEEQADELRTSILIDSNLTPAQLKELNNFIIMKEHTNDTIVDEKDLLAEGIEVFESFREPKVSLSISVVNFMSVIESQNDWDKLSLGDTVKLESKRLKVSISSKIIEINYDFDADTINLTIANEKEIKDDYKKLLDMVYSASNTSTVVNMDKYKWDMIDDVNGLVNQMLTQAWDANKNAVVGGYKQKIEITERGLIARSDEDPMSWLILQNAMLSITNDNGNTWKQAIRKDGIVADRLVGKLVISAKMIIEDENGVIRIKGNLQEIFDREGNVKVSLGEYEPDKYGLKVVDGAVDIRTSSISNRGVVFDASGIRGYNESGVKTFDIDSEGNAMFGGHLNGASGTFSGNLSAAGGTFSGDISGASGTFTGALSGASITGGTINGASITSSASHSAVQIIGGSITSSSVQNSDAVYINSGSAVFSTSTSRSIVESGRVEVSNFTTDKTISINTTYSDAVIACTTNNYNRADLTIDALTHFKGSVNFTNASVVGITAKFG